MSAWLKVPAPASGTNRAAARQRRFKVEVDLRLSLIASSRASTR
jgi:hypothetical protein